MAVKSRYVIGRGAMLDLAAAICGSISVDARVVRIEIGQGPDYRFDWSALDVIENDAEVFMAFDERFGNFSRLELFQGAIERGLRMPALVSPRALVAVNVKLGPNTLLGDGVIVGPDSTIEYNCVLQAGVIVGTGVRIKTACWVSSGVQIGDGAEIGAHTTLRQGVLVAPGVKIGRNCDIGIAGTYRDDVAARTVFDPRYDARIVVFGN